MIAVITSDTCDGTMFDDVLVIPDDMSLESEKSVYDRWYQEVYLKNRGLATRVKLMNFADYLIDRGARKPTKEEVTVFEV